jgi:hypothetical protein
MAHMDPISSKHHEFHEDQALILPDELLVNVFKFLDQPKDILQVLAVNRRWRAMGLGPMNKVLDAKIKEINEYCLKPLIVTLIRGERSRK